MSQNANAHSRQGNEREISTHSWHHGAQSCPPLRTHILSVRSASSLEWDHDQGHIFFAAEFQKEPTQVFRCLVIQSACGFVGKEKLWLPNQGSNHSNALSFTSRKLPRTMIQPMRQPHSIEKLFSPIFQGSIGNQRGLCQKRYQDIFDNRECGSK